MLIEQIFTDCISEAAYVIYDEQEAAVVDPLTEPYPYLQLARKHQVRIKYILLTHFHADFVSGHRELAEKTGATIILGPTATPSFPAHVATDGECFALGKGHIQLLHTPGHSLESSCYLAHDAEGDPTALFSGDTLLMNTVGRTDIIQQVRAEFTPAFMAGLLYDSLRNHIAPIPDEVIVYPGHGAGSACGADIGEQRFDTLGSQRRVNFALQPLLKRSEFIEHVLYVLPSLPPNFAFNILHNREYNGADWDALHHRGTTALSAEQVREQVQHEEAVILDTRRAEAFASVHIPGSLQADFSCGFSDTVRYLVTDLRRPLVLIADKTEVQDIVSVLLRIGYECVLGYLKGGIKSWTQAGGQTHSWIMEREALPPIHLPMILDVAAVKPHGLLLDQNSIRLDNWREWANQLPKGATIQFRGASLRLRCAIASALQQQGFHVSDVLHELIVEQDEKPTLLR
jgi:glyoxylase-like metal-dependent hydrolase (beta-lactamase superfamily II)/rhodanese-related sulfurtransferase